MAFRRQLNTRNMTKLTQMKQILCSCAIATIIGGCATQPDYATEPGYPAAAMAESPVTWNTAGELIRPDTWRDWIFVGAPVTPNDMNGGKAAFPEFHNVYIDRSSFDVYKNSGEFPDGTAIIKELVSVGAKESVSGQGYFQGDFIGLEAAIKSRTRHANEPGYWAYYSFTDPNGGPLKDAAPAFPTTACNSCHQAAAEEDWVFTQHYPVLRAVK